MKLCDVVETWRTSIGQILILVIPKTDFKFLKLVVFLRAEHGAVVRYDLEFTLRPLLSIKLHLFFD